MHIDAAKIHTEQLQTELALASTWADRYRAAQDRKLIAAMALCRKQPTQQPVASKASSRYPSSGAGARLQLGGKLDDEAYNNVMANLEQARQKRGMQHQLHRPLMSSPRKPMPHFYGCSLHGDSVTNTDPRVGGSGS